MASLTTRKAARDRIRQVFEAALDRVIPAGESIPLKGTAFLDFEEQVEGLKKLGEWMAINKPALYATTPASFDKAGTYNWKSGSLRYLRKDKYLYAIDLEKPTAPRVIPDVTAVSGSEIKMLGSDKSLTWRQDGDDLVIEEFPDPLPCDYAWSFKIQVLDESW